VWANVVLQFDVELLGWRADSCCFMEDMGSYAMFILLKVQGLLV